MQIHYVEIVTPELESTCALFERSHGVTFSDPVPELGQARLADLAGGGRLSIRKPMSEQEQSVVRPYVLVDDIHAATRAAEEAGGMIAHPPMELPGQGWFSIYFLGGIEHGLWQR